jgi:hypothetical protein
MTAIHLIQQLLDYLYYLDACKALRITPSLKDFLNGEISDEVMHQMCDIESARRAA